MKIIINRGFELLNRCFGTVVQPEKIPSGHFLVVLNMLQPLLKQVVIFWMLNKLLETTRVLVVLV